MVVLKLCFNKALPGYGWMEYSFKPVGRLMTRRYLKSLYGKKKKKKEFKMGEEEDVSATHKFNRTFIVGGPYCLKH